MRFMVWGRGKVQGIHRNQHSLFAIFVPFAANRVFYLSDLSVTGSSPSSIRKVSVRFMVSS
jgi:hypothetical protein